MLILQYLFEKLWHNYRLGRFLKVSLSIPLSFVGMALVVLLFMPMGCTRKGASHQVAERVESPREGGEVRIGLWTPPLGVFNPLFAVDPGDREITSFMFESLLYYGSDLSPRPGLAVNYAISPDQTAITFILRGGVRWHDGQPFTVDDVVFTWETVLKKEYDGPYRDNLLLIKGAKEFRSGKASKVEGIKAEGQRITVVLEQPFGPGLMKIGSVPIIPQHVFKDKDIRAMKAVPAGEAKPIGTGPFRYEKAVVVSSADKSRQSVAEISLLRNEAYHLGRPYIQRVTFITLGPTANVSQLNKRGIDIIRLRREDASTVATRNRFRLFEWPEGGYYYLAANLAYRPFDDLRVREAIAYALDRPRIIQSLMGGHGTVINAPLIPGSWADPGDLDNHGPDTRKARELLRQAGWDRTSEEGFVLRNGRELTFNLFYRKDEPLDETLASMIKEHLGAAGIRVYVIGKDQKDLLNQVFSKRAFDMYLLTWQLGPDPEVSSIFALGSSGNAMGYENKAATDALVAAVKLLDIDKRKPLYYQWARTANEELPHIFLFAPNNVVAVATRVRGFSVNPIGKSYPWEWWVAAP